MTKIRLAMMTAVSLMAMSCSKAPEEASAPMTDVADAGLSGPSDMGTPPPASPAAARVTTETVETSIAGVVRTRRVTTTSEPVAMPVPTAPPIVEPDHAVPREQPQSGVLTAGDYDDLLNPRAYAQYASDFIQNGSDLPFVDTRSRISIQVVDTDRRPVPFADVSMTRVGPPLRLRTTADGVVSFYPAFDKVKGQVKATITSKAGSAASTIDVGKGPQNLSIMLKGSAPAVTALDLLLVVDTTGSMGDEIAYLLAEIESIVARVRNDAGNVDIRVGIIAYRDEGDAYVVKAFGMTGNVTAARNVLAKLDAGGGGDTPEAMDQAISAADSLQWRPDAVKAMLLIADAPPHDEQLDATLLKAQDLRSKGVQIVPVAASGVDDKAEYVMRTMAAMTQGRYIFLTDDSGVGDAHATPQVSCYLVTHLDGLIARVVAGMVQGRRIEPRSKDIVRKVGDYRQGRCGSENGATGRQ